MPLSLDDLRKTTSVSRKDKRRFIAPTLIESAEERKLVTEVCQYFADFAKSKKRQGDFSEQYLTERAGGDFKLARGLISAMLGFYSWEAETFAERLRASEFKQMQAIELATPSALRLALYDYLNAAGRPGFVRGGEARAEALEFFAAGVGLEPNLIDQLLWLDADENALLRLRKRQDGSDFRSPTSGEVVRRYNRLAVETLLYNASEVVFNLGSELPGPLVKRIGFLSKILYIPYDMDYNAAGEVQLRLYGPAQAFGPPTRHGEKLAELALKIFALARRLPRQETEIVAYSGPRSSMLQKSGPATKTVAKAAPALIQAAFAQVHIKDKIYHFDLGARIQHLAPYQPEEDDISPTAIENEETDGKELGGNAIREKGAVYQVGPPAAKEPDFDSSVEARFYIEFSALAREGHTAGWQLIREPEALALPDQNLLFIPDFGLKRDKHKIWLEVIGFWTPDYRLRKLEKLDKLKQYSNHKILLAVARELEADFTTGPSGEKRALPYPVIFYKNSLRATEVVSLLQREFDDREGRLEQVGQGREFLEALLTESGFVTEKQLYNLLKVYNKSELRAALQKLALSPSYIENYGLCSPAYFESARVALQAALPTPTARLELEAAAEVLKQAALPADPDQLEALILHLPGLQVARPSLFELYVQLYPA